MPVVTYSPAVTLVPTHECFNRCTYCNFRQDIGHGAWLSLNQAEAELRQLQGQGICEILILAGEVAPNGSTRQAWFERIWQLGQLAVDLGFLPHTNAGVLSPKELAKLRSVNVSQGLMLEQVTPMLLKTVHRHAPTKAPTLRIEHLAQAGTLKIPCTTGLLLGIGEAPADRLQTLGVIAELHQCWGHIQEVILQPYSPARDQIIPNLGFDWVELPALIHQARKILPPEITIQVPPNLIPSFELLLACLEAGVRDLGGLVPHDYVNPNYAHPDLTTLQTQLHQAGWDLKPRLPIYPPFVEMVADHLRGLVHQWQTQFDAHSGIAPLSSLSHAG